MNPRTIQPGSVVRAISTIGTNQPRAIYAVVLNVGVQSDADLGDNGEPSLSLVCLDRFTPSLLGKVDWHMQFSRHGGVRHVSHEDVKAGLVGICWVDLLPPAGAEVDLDDLDLPVPAAPVPAPQPGSHLGAAEAAPALTAGPDVPAITTVHVEGVKDDLPANSDVDINGELVPVANLKPGDLLDFFQLRVTGVETADGVMTVSTEPVQPAAPPATPPAEATATAPATTAAQ